MTLGGIGFIPFTEMNAYADAFGIANRAEFLELVRAMDAAFVKHHTDKADEPNPKG